MKRDHEGKAGFWQLCCIGQKWTLARCCMHPFNLKLLFCYVGKLIDLKRKITPNLQFVSLKSEGFTYILRCINCLFVLLLKDRNVADCICICLWCCFQHSVTASRIQDFYLFLNFIQKGLVWNRVVKMLPCHERIHNCLNLRFNCGGER